MKIQFGEYLPDMPALDNQGARVAKNVVPMGTSYQPFYAAVVYSNALTARCQGAISTKDKDGNSLTYAGDATKLYKLSSAAYSDVSLSGGYTIAADDLWQFTRFGGRLIATNFSEYPQTINVPLGTNFANLTTALKARYVTTMRNFVVFANTYDASDGNVPHRIRWSALDDPTDYTVSPTTQSDFQDLDASSGWIKQIVGGEYGVVFQERAITRMTYSGSPTIWQFDEVEKGKGTIAPGSVCKAGNIIFYLGLDGFYAFDGTQSIPIGANKVDKTFFSEVDANYINRITSTADFDNQVIYWLYAASDNSNGVPNKILAYNYSPNAQKRWSYIEPGDIEIIFISLSEGYTLETLDNISASLDSLPYSLDSRVWTGENYILSGFNSAHKHVNFTGSAMDATVETGEFQIYPSNRALVSLVRPLIDGGSTITVQMGTRNTQAEEVSYASSVSINSTGNCPVRSNARYHSIRVNVTGGFTHAQGVQIEKATKSGER